ncbi:hypothetical protein [Streptomyces eurythermus]|uniref:hypothetical protein n=1 Tax=Streptomyces eurythermus TaxID=42237 RepID=UPI00341169C1
MGGRRTSGREAAAGADPRAEEPSRVHGGRARSAYDRAAGACRYAGVGPDAAEIVPTDAAGRAANAPRLTARSLAALAETAPVETSPTETAPTETALAETALTETVPDPAAEARFSRSAAAAADGTARRRDASLNAAAEETERHAVATARAAGRLDRPDPIIDRAARPDGRAHRMD